MTKIYFNEYGVSGTKSGICPSCGKRASRSIKFSQTQNPFNKNADGLIKTVEEIHAECRGRLMEWKKQPTCHEKCEEL